MTQIMTISKILKLSHKYAQGFKGQNEQNEEKTRRPKFWRGQDPGLCLDLRGRNL